MFFRHSFLENGVGGWLFIFIFFHNTFVRKRCIKVKCRKFQTFTVCSNQWVHQKSNNKLKPKKTVATGGQIKVTVRCLNIINANTGNAIKTLMQGV